MSDETATIEISIAGQWYNRFVSFQIEADILTPADAFSVAFANPGGKLAGKIGKWDEVRIKIDGSTQMRGFVDEVRYRGGNVEISGRDAGGQLVDCSAAPKTHKKVTLKTLAEKLSTGYVSSWSVQEGITLKVHPWVKIEPGEKIMDVLTRIATKEGVLIWIDASGEGVIGLPDYDQTASHLVRRYAPGSDLASANNVLDDSEVVLSGREQYSTITVLGASGGTDSVWGSTAQQKASDTDAEVTLTRLLSVSEGDVKSISETKARAEDEIERRAWEAEKLTYYLRGFYGSPTRGGSSKLYAFDQRVDVLDEMAGIEGIYYLSRRKLKRGADGDRAEIELHPNGWMGGKKGKTEKKGKKAGLWG